MADFVSLTGGAEVIEVTVSDSAAIAGESLSEADAEGLLPDDLLVVGIERDDEIVTPKGDTTIQAGDVVTVVSPQAEADSLINVFSTRAEPTSVAGRQGYALASLSRSVRTVDAGLRVAR